MRTNRHARITRRTLLSVLGGALAGSLAVSLGGCVGYTTYPAASWQAASAEMNGPPADEIMVESVRWAVNRYEAGTTGSIAINLPEVVRDRTYSIIAFQAGERVVAMERGLEDLPTYHLTRLWVRGDKAEVDLLRPVNELGASPTGDPIIQAVTLYIEGGLHAWRVERARHWKIGTDAVPPLHFYGDGDTRMSDENLDREHSPSGEMPDRMWGEDGRGPGRPAGGAGGADDAEEPIIDLDS